MIYGIVMSFSSWSININDPVNFVGLDNYKRLLIGDGLSAYRFKKSMANLFFYILFTIPIGIFVAVAIALVVDSFSKTTYRFFRGVFFLPTAVPLFLGAGVWLWLFTADAGFVSVMLGKLGIGSGVIWKNSKGYAIAMCVIVDVWRSVGFNMVLLTAGMKGIAREYYEAARVDGASVFQIMRKITLPLIEPILFFIVVNGFISALQVYDVPWILSSTGTVGTTGGPNQVMLFPVMDMVTKVYAGGKANLGRACAEGVLLLLLILAITIAQLLFRRKDKA